MEEKKTRTEWHPAFVNAMEIEFRDNAGDLHFTPEYNLTKKPLEVDLLVVRKDPGTVIKNEIGRIFKDHNIFEYKSPDDSMNIDTFYKTIAYACLYKVEEKERDAEGRIIHRQPEDITITMVRHSKPEALFDDLAKRNIKIIQESPGIYSVGRIIGFDVQIIVSGELSLEHHTWLQSLQRNIQFDNLDKVYESMVTAKDETIKKRMLSYMDFISKENSDVTKRWKEESDMGEGLAMLMEPELKEAENKGIEKGREEGREELKAEMIKQMYRDGISIEYIKKLTGVSYDTIDALTKEVDNEGISLEFGYNEDEYEQ